MTEQRSEEPPAGSQSVRSSEEAGNDRGAKGREESGWPMNQNDEQIKTSPASVAATPQQAGEAPARRDPWWWVERSIWTEAMLSRLASGEPAHRVWFRLWDKTYAPANLQSAFQKVRRNGGSAGVDQQTLGHFERQAEAQLQKLHEELSEGLYRAQPAKRVWIPKPGSKEQRPLGIPVVRDRIVQGALRHVLEPIFETNFAEHSYGFRPGRGAKDALRRVDQLLKAGHVHVVDADLKSYFDTIPHQRLLTLLKERVADGRVLALVESFLRAGVMEEARGWQATEGGTPQGGVISPLLANIYLNPLDHQMAQGGWEMVRYADDFVILCRSRTEAEEALAAVRDWVKEAGLQLHPEKTRITEASQKGGGFDFLGYHFERGRRWPRAKSLRQFKDKLRTHTQRNQGRSWEEIVDGLNRSLRGWFEYYQHSVANVFGSLDGFARRRLRSLLAKRRGRTVHGKGSAHQRWSNEWMARHGVESLQALHDWKRTIVALRTH
jgi:RNA-directed DNA polymerase